MAKIESMLTDIHKVYPHWQPSPKGNRDAQIYAVWNRVCNRKRIPYQISMKLDPIPEKYKQIKMEGF